MAQRILITGHRGYIGSVMTRRLVEEGHIVTGVDCGLYDGCTLVPDAARVRASVEERRADVRDLDTRDLAGFDALIHLAALSNDPVGNLNRRWTREINFEASVNLARVAREAGVARFLFSSSCILYGEAGAGVEVDETAKLDPRTDYARSKVEAERAISDLASERFSPVFLRNGTVYGLSPRMRFDTVLNHLVGSAVATGVARVWGDGKPWRPVVHIEDVASAFVAALAAPRERIHNEAFNVGAAFSNWEIGTLAGRVVDLVPGATLEVLARPDADARTYRARFDKIARLLPAFAPRWTAEAGIRRLAADLRGLTRADLEDPRFTRLAWIRHQLERARLDDDLRPVTRCVRVETAA